MKDPAELSPATPPAPPAAPGPTGLVVVDKPAGITSHDVVGRLRRIFHTRRVGHAGTLDPIATGVLVACLGAATRIAEYVAGGDKEYIAGITFGVTTDTQDAEGAVRSECDASALTAGDVERSLVRFRGDIHQVPPMVSAVHHHGQRLYELARQGVEVERHPRPVRISRLDLLTFEPGRRATATLRVACSTGTYIRTLAADLGEALGVGAMMHSLRRTRVGAFSIEAARSLDELAAREGAGTLRCALLPLGEALAHWPRAILSAEEVGRIAHGQPITRHSAAPGPGEAADPALVLLLDEAGEAIGLARSDGGILKPVKVFRAAG